MAIATVGFGYRLIVRMEPTTMALLGLAALIAGFVDAVAGGGGLITLPALLAAGLPPLDALATNKAQSTWGSTAALVRFAGTRLLDRGPAAWSFFAGMAGAMIGVLILTEVPNHALRPLVLVLLLMAAGMVAAVRPRPRASAIHRPLWWSLAVAGGIGAYDGFFGPGTGTLLILAYVLIWHQAYDAASANAKVVNCGSNWGAFLCFIGMGLIQWPVALAMAAGQILGGWMGAHLVVRKGQGLVRLLAAAVSMALAARVAWQLFRG